MCGGIGQKRHMPRVLQRDGQPTLVLGAGAGLAARLDLGAVGQEAAQPHQVLVVDVVDLVDAELANLAARRVLAARAPAGATRSRS